MGVELIAGLAASALGAGINAYNQNQTAKREEENAAQGIMQQAARQRDADAAVNSEVDKLKNSNPDAARDAATVQFMDQLRRSRAQAEGTPDALASDRFNSDTAAANEKNFNIGKRAANLMSRINAPAQQRTAEGQGTAQLASDISGIARNSAADQFLTNLRARSIQPNAGLSIAGDLVSGVGSGLTSRATTKSPYRAGVTYKPVDLEKGITVTG